MSKLIKILIVFGALNLIAVLSVAVALIKPPQIKIVYKEVQGKCEEANTRINGYATGESY